MENINIGILDYCILAIYVCLMLGVGFYFKASAKMADYAVADKKLGLSVLIGTFLATGIGGGVLTCSTGNGYAAGIMELPKLIALFGINIFLGLFMAGKMRKIGGFTAPQMLGKVYGKNCQAIGGIFCIIFQMGSGIAAQYVALGTCFNVLLGIDARIGMAIGAVIIIIITYSSGMWGVAITDYIQFVFLGLGVLVATAVCFASADGWQGIASAAPESYFEIDPVSSIKLLCSTSLAVLIDGNRYSRFFSAKDAKTASRAALITAVPQFLVGFFAMVMGLAALVVLPAGTPKDMVFPSLLAITIPTGLKGLCIGALIAAILSTADSYILTTSTNVSIDIYKNLINPNATDTQTLKVTRFSVIGAGVVGLVFALLLPDVIGLWTLSSTAYIGGCLIPMMYGLFSKKKKSYTAAMVAILGGGLFAVISEMSGFVLFDLPAIVYGIVISAVLLFLITPFAKDAKEVNVEVGTE